jgi:predicted dehydrogenase
MTLFRGVHTESPERPIKLALIGCGGRGNGALTQALATAGPTQVHALADVLEVRTEWAANNLAKERGDEPHKFVGFDAYRKAMDGLNAGDVVLLVTPPAFRPLHLEYAVSRGLHVFMEKSFAVDGPGYRRIVAAGQEADKKNLKIAGGLMSRHNPSIEEAVKRIHGGEIGDVVACYCYRDHGPIGNGVGYYRFLAREACRNELLYQCANYISFTWASGSFISDWMIHNIDVACWCKNAWPVSAQGQGGRQVRDSADQLYDHHMVDYEFADGTKLISQGRIIDGCWSWSGCIIHGTKGVAIVGEGVPVPKLYRGHQPGNPKDLIWSATREVSQWRYQREHDLLFDAIRNGRPYNETARCAEATLTAIMGRMAVESGKMVTRMDAAGSAVELAAVDKLTVDSPAPVQPGSDGRYPIAMPGAA